MRAAFGHPAAQRCAGDVPGQSWNRSSWDLPRRTRPPSRKVTVARHSWSDGGEDAEVKSWDCHFSDTLLAGAAHAGGDAVDGDDEGMAELWIGLVLAHAPEHFNLHQIDRIDVRVPHID
jgi:hypothetical protein